MSSEKFYSDSTELQLGMRLGKGGEGEVYALKDRSEIAFKRYFSPEDKANKILAMVEAGLAHSSKMVAFPLARVVDQHGKFVGFLMRSVTGHQPLHQLYSPASRLRHFQKADFRFLVRAAANLSTAIAEVHESNCVIGDINHSGILVSEKATVTLIDADSFQFQNGKERFLCSVGVPEYTAPELQGGSLRGKVRTKDHDRFGLAVAIFQLLFMGRHPFSGTPVMNREIPLETAIAEFRFAYSKTRATGLQAPPKTARLSDLPAEISLAFERTFAPESVSGRPTALEWMNYLVKLEKSIRMCGSNRLHHYSREATECPWCRMEAYYPTALFISFDINVGVAGGHQAISVSASTLLATVNSLVVPTSIPRRTPSSQATESPSERARNIKSKLEGTKLGRIFGWILVAAAVLLLQSMGFFIILLPLALGVWLLFRSPDYVGPLREEASNLANKITQRVEAQYSSCPVIPMIRSKANALDLVDEYKQLTEELIDLEKIFRGQRREIQLKSYLAGIMIRNAEISKVSKSDKVSLISYGFETALDVKTRDVQLAHGIGPVKSANIAAWVRTVEAKFVFRTAMSSDEQRQFRLLQIEAIKKQQGAFEKVQQELNRLRRLSKDYETWFSSRDLELENLHLAWERHKIDFEFIDVLPPRLSLPEPPNVPTISSLRKVSSKITRQSPPSTWVQSPKPPRRSALRKSSTQCPTCPKCGSGMVKRTARRGSKPGSKFWGCQRYPTCKGTKPL